MMGVWRLLVLFLAGFPVLVNAYGLTQCAGDRYGDDLNCTANDVSISAISLSGGGATSCVGGSTFTADLDITVNFATPDRWDIGIFIPNDSRDAQVTIANGGATSCSVAILPLTAPFLDLDGGGATPRDACGDGNGSINGGTGQGNITLNNVTLPCLAADGSGRVFVAYVVSWDNQASPSGLACYSIADPVPNTKSKCNAPDPALGQGFISVIALPQIVKSDGISQISPGVPTSYAITITNSTGFTLSTLNGNAAVFKDPAVTNLLVSSVTCSASGGAVCPASTTVPGMQDVGLTIPSMPNGSSVTFLVTARVSGAATPESSITNTATVTVKGQTNTASDTNTVVFPSLLFLKTVATISDPVNGATNPKNIPGAEVDYTLRVTNTGAGRAGNLTIVDPIPLNTELFTGGLSGGAPFSFVNSGSGLTCGFAALNDFTDCVDFSNGGTVWNYVPNGAYDPTVTHIRFKPVTTMSGDASPGPPSPYFDLTFRVRVK